jgi:hypothetical protein
MIKHWMLLAAAVLLSGIVLAGELDSPAPPSSTNSAMYTVSDLYDRLDHGAPGSLRTGPFAEPADGPASTGHTLNEIMGRAPAQDNASGAGRSDVLTGRVFWGLSSNQWGRQTGSVPLRVLSPGSSWLFSGIYATTNLTVVDTDLTNANIRAGVTIFGVSGLASVVNTAGGTAATNDIMAGKIAWVNGQAVTGAIPSQALSPATNVVVAGYYGATNLSLVDGDLVTGNVRAGVSLFGIDGKTEVVDTTSGNAASGDLLSGKVAWVDGGAVTGTIPTQVLSPATNGVAAGYYVATNLSLVDPSLATGNIRAGAAIFGVPGLASVVNTASGTAGGGDVMAGKIAWVNGHAVTGVIPTQAISPVSAAILAGYYGATNLTSVDSDLATGNIRAGISIFGVNGKTEVVDTSSGDAVASDLMAGRTAWVDGGAVTGTIPTQALSPATNTVAAGYYAATNLSLVDMDLTNANIRGGVTIFGVPGLASVVNTASGTAGAGDVMAGKVAWVNGQAVTGAIPTQAISPASATILAGYYGATNLTSVDSDLATGNVRAGVSIFGVNGKTEVVDTTSGNAGAGDLMSGKVAWVDGAEVTGTIPTQTLSPATSAVSAGYYAATDLSVVDPSLTTGNIRGGATIFGVPGLASVVNTASGTAGVGDVMAGKIAWVNGLAVTGAIPTQVLSPASATILAGYYGGTNLTSVDSDLATGNIRAGITIFGVNGKTEVVDTTSGDAVASDLMAGRIAWVDGGAVTGTIPTQTLSPATNAVVAGYYAATNLSLVDLDLTNGNIRAGVSIFGVDGKPEVVDTSSGNATTNDIMAGVIAWVDGSAVTGTIPTRALSASTTAVNAGYYASNDLVSVDADLTAANLKGGVSLFGITGVRFAVIAETGQTNTYGNGGSDGALRPGVAWPSPRFTVGTGEAANTVTDNLTRLVWVRNGNLLGTSTNWSGAASYCTNLVYGGRDDWRLPTRFELESLTDLGQAGSSVAVLPTGATNFFSNVWVDVYWSSTTYAVSTGTAWCVDMGTGLVPYKTKTLTSYYLWPVAGGE